GAERRYFPVAEMAGEENRGLAVVAQRVEQLLGACAELDATRLVRLIDVVVPDVVEMGELGADAAEIVPDARENLLHRFRRFLGEGGFEVFAADAVLAQAAADELRGSAEEVRRLVRIEQARGAQQRNREAAHRGLAKRLEGVAQARLDAKKEQAVHRKAAE